LNLRASRRLGRRDYSGAAACYKEIADAEPEQWAALLMLAHCHERQGQHAHALAASMRAVHAQPDQFLALQSMARACVNLQNHHTAKLYVERALAVAPLPVSSREERFFLFLARAIVAGMRLLPRYRKRIPPTKALDLDPTRSLREWMDWAREYLAWYSTTFPSSGPPVN
jgi:tetratricopeptide (TPR) repeat protein